MPDGPSKAWFAPKRYGYGSSLPIAWQGWVVLALFIVAVTVLSVATHGAWRFIGIAVAIIALAIICARTTEGGVRWRWGDRK